MNQRRRTTTAANHHTYLDTSETTSTTTTTTSTTFHDDVHIDNGDDGMSDAVAEFDALRREATKLERHLEDNVARYQQLAQRLMTGDDDRGRRRPSSATSSSLLDSAESGALRKSDQISDETEESSLSSDISRTISAMSDLVNDRMSPAADRTGRAQHALLVKRFREILFDRSTDFRKTAAAVARRRESRELFARRSAANGGGGSGGDDRDDDAESLLRERGAISNSLSAARDVIGQAESVRGDLRSQGSSLRGISGTMTSIAGQVPGLNHVIESIRRKRSRDDIIVSGLIAACILFTLWYVFVA